MWEEFYLLCLSLDLGRNDKTEKVLRIENVDDMGWVRNAYEEDIKRHTMEKPYHATTLES